MDDYKHIRELANADVDTLQRKNEEYGSSWRKRGGIGAFMMLARKWDRLETQCQDAGYDIFLRIKAELDAGITKDGILDDIRDLRSYLLLVESHMTAPKTGAQVVMMGDSTTVLEGHVKGSELVDYVNTALGEPGPGSVNRPATPEDYGMTTQCSQEGEPGPGYVSQDPDVGRGGAFRCFSCGSEGLYHAPHCPTQASDEPRRSRLKDYSSPDLSFQAPGARG